ncbi:MAG: hypothetical protein AB7J13_15585 [Pyrinomonadaceae bacterium]
MEPNKATIDRLTRYLLHEASEAERDDMEQAFFEDDELFYSMLELENDLTDKYAARRMPRDEREQFESSVAAIPARRQKVANAIALHDVIVHEANPSIKSQTDALLPVSGWQRFFDSLRAQKRLLGLSAVSMVLLMGIGTAFVSIAVLSMLSGDSSSPDVYSNSYPANSAAPPAYQAPRVELRPNTAQAIVEIDLPQSQEDATVHLIVPSAETTSPFKAVLDGSQDLSTSIFRTNNDRETGVTVTIPAKGIKESPHKIVVTVDRGSKFEYHFRFRR